MAQTEMSCCGRIVIAVAMDKSIQNYVLTHIENSGITFALPVYAVRDGMGGIAK